MNANANEGGVISTGNNEIDKKMGGGIPRGSLSLIEGQSDSGKSVLTQQMTWGSLSNGYRATIFTTENTIRSLVRQMQSLGLDILDYLLLGRLRIYPASPEQSRIGKRGLVSLLEALKQEADQDLLIIDALTTYIDQTATKELFAYFEGCKRDCDTGKTIINVVHSYALEPSTLVRIGSLCDCHIRLTIEQAGDMLVKSMEVAKVRGAEKKTGNVVNFEVEPKVGMRMVPFSRARA